MAKIKVASSRSLFGDGKGFFADKKYSVDEEQATAHTREGWVAEWSAESDGTAQIDSGDGDDGDIADDLTDGQGGGEGPDGTDVGDV